MNQKVGKTVSGLDYRSALALIRRGIQGHRARLVLASGIAIGSAACEVVVAWVVWRALAAVVAHAVTAQLLMKYAVIALIAVLGQQVLFGVSTAVSHLVAFDVIAEVRGELGRAWISSPVGRLARQHSAAAKNSAIDQCERLEIYIAHAIPETVASVSVWLAVTAWLGTVNLWLTLATIVLVPVSFATMLHAMRSNGHRMGDYVQASNDMNDAVVDFLAALPVIRAFNRVGTSHERTRRTVLRTARLQSDWGKAFLAWGSPFSTLVVSGLACIVPVGVWLHSSGQVSTPDLLLFFILGPSYTVPLVKIFQRMVVLPVLAAGAKGILQELSVEPISSCGDALPQDVTSEVRFEQVSFAYTNDRDVLHEVSFTVAAGSMTAIVGKSGSGKTTLAELLLGFHQPREGRITIGGHDVSTLSEADLYRCVSAVFQRPYLHTGTLRENTTLALPDASDKQLDRVFIAAGLEDVVSSLKEGADTQLGEGGAGLSGGEKQRVAIARALLADRPIIVLDEVTAATDAATETLIQRGLSDLLGGRTSIVIAHRLRTIVGADQIVVLDEGRVAEVGTHDELVQRGGTYARMWTDHIAAQELALRAVGDVVLEADR
ncbi:MAG: ABC transporter ATP-binding protein [Propionibacteriaceae bacterium]|nr:ABC transporter ATP-binding protein [Propionibacteriaceae bacterium]